MTERKPLLARPVEAWRKCSPNAMATKQSPAAIEYGFADARHDILALDDLRVELVAALQVALKALDSIGDEMTVGDRFTNAGQQLLDALEPIRDAIAHATGAAA